MRTVLRALFIVILLLSLGANGLVVLLIVMASGSPHHVATTVVKEGDASQKVAVILLAGEIDEGASRLVDRCLSQIEEDSDVRAVVLEIDSPGGSVTASDEIYRRIRRFKADRSQRGLSNQVVVTMKSMATSGGYYAACAGDYLFAEPTTLTGNIGVLMPRYNVSELIEKYGVKETTVVSSGTPYKNAGSPFQPESQFDQRYLQSLADHAFDRFKAVVQEGRGARLVAPGGEVFNGKVFVADEAQAAGLVDEVGYPRDAYAYAARQAGLGRPMIVRYEAPAPSLLGLLTRAGDVRPAVGRGSVMINGLEVNAGPEALDRLRTHRLLYR